jgi:mono/diheme cytochrome c family protein
MRKWAYLAAVAALVGLGGPEKAAAQTTEPQVKSSFQPDQALAAEGRKLFTANGCMACHSIGQGVMAGPDLKGVVDRAPIDWLRAFLKNPRQQFNNGDPRTVAIVEQHKGAVMPNFRLRDDEIEKLLHYLATAQKR